MSELGLTLREAREAMGLNLEDLQERTKIQKRYLQAIEDGEFNRLPGHFYTRAFIKSYAESVGLNTNELFETYRSEIPKSGVEIEDLPPRNTREAIRPSSNRTWSKNLPVVAVVVGVIIILVVVWVIAQHLMSGKNSANADSTKPDASFKQAQNIGNGTKKTVNKSTSQTNTSDQTKSNTSAKQPSSTGTDTSKPTQNVTLTKSQGSDFTYTVSGAQNLNLDVIANPGQSSWVEIYDTSTSGKRYYYGNVSATGSKNQTFSQDLSQLKQVYLKVGNVQSVTIKINGQALSLQKNPVFQHITIINKP